MKREQAGLKSLIGGLVNGSALLQAWESQWHDSFGGEEMDEIDEEMGSDEEEGDGEGDDDDEDSGRAKKKARTVKPAKEKPAKQPSAVPAVPRIIATTSNVLPEKRKRGRPRKVTAPSPAATMVMPVPMDTNAYPTYGVQPSGQQYLLAAFAFISFFNSPLTSSAPPYTQPHSHTGSVLNHHIPTRLPAGYGWRDIIQIFHLTVSALVFLSIVVPWLPKTFKQTRFASMVLSPLNTIFPASLRPRVSSAPVDSISDSPNLVTVSHNGGADRDALIEALSSTSRGSESEGRALRKALGITTGIVGLCQGVFKAGKKDRGIELNQLEQRAWVRLGEIVALDGMLFVLRPGSHRLTVLQTLFQLLLVYKHIGACRGTVPHSPRPLPT